MSKTALVDMIGRRHRLVVQRRTTLGYVLLAQDDEVLLPLRESPAKLEVGQVVDVFLYTDSSDRVVATTRVPLAQVGDFACLRVVDQNAHGAFLNWGLDKDLFCPLSEQHSRMEVGQDHVVAVYLDNHTGRVAAASRLAEFFDYDVSHLKRGDHVTALVYGQTERGFQLIVNERHAGLSYKDQTFMSLQVGQRVEGYVQQVRDDNKLDISLTPLEELRPRDKRQGDQELVLAALERAGGTLRIGDKSSPDQVHAALAMSKKAFKAAVGQLYRRGLVMPGDHETRSSKMAKQTKKEG